ncbi:MAG TPA: HTH domain-containing protein [Thermosulfurimonas dismutans]|uniref:HTH domain-containing protein n=1 Tax=Thermosulfurimonas dismutans TaxID=999894 RepID=A0A7C3CF29_9BACT|nr:HTH domain-containing protein [Thermosulfurimonas dismutans]
MARKRSRMITKEDVRFIYENYHKMTSQEIAEKLGISRFQVTKVVSELRKRGVNIPKKAGKRKNPIDEFVEELKKGKKG